MGVDRKQFLKLMVTGGLGALVGGTSAVPKQWKEQGVRLTSVQRQSLVMGSLISFEVIAGTEEAGYEAIRRAERQFRLLDGLFSMYDKNSEMADLARHAGASPLVVSEESRSLLTFAKTVFKKSKGAFDVTIEPAMQCWGFRKSPQKNISRPTDRELRKLERIIGSEKIRIEDDRVLLAERGMAIDTGGIAGGYALDAAVWTMKKCDVSAAFINFSGDIHCFGEPMQGEKWPVYILDPRTQEPLTEPVYLVDEALSTSGAYQNRRHDRHRHSWGHLLSPAQTEPVEPVGSVTAIHSSAMMADAWSTASYVGGQAPPEVRTIRLQGS